MKTQEKHFKFLFPNISIDTPQKTSIGNINNYLLIDKVNESYTIWSNRFRFSNLRFLGKCDLLI